MEKRLILKVHKKNKLVEIEYCVKHFDISDDSNLVVAEIDGDSKVESRQSDTPPKKNIGEQLELEFDGEMNYE